MIVGTQRALSRCVAAEMTRQRPDLARPAAAGARSAIVLVTWQDLAREADADALIAHVTSQLRASAHAGHAIIGITVCVLPYGAFSDGDDLVLQFPVAGDRTRGTADPAHAIERAARAAEAAGHLPCRIVFSPMVVSDDADESGGYPSLAHKLARVAVCLAEEVRSKVPDYFSLFDLKVHSRHGALHVATCSQLVSALLACVDEETLHRGTPTMFLESPVTWLQFTTALRDGCGVPVAHAQQADDCNALDETFSEIVFSELEAQIAATRYAAGRRTATVVGGDGVLNAVAALARLPVRPWESSYRAVRDVDLGHATGLEACTASPHIGYRAGGAGPPVLVIAPFGVDPGYFSDIVSDLVADHRLILWQSTGHQVARVAGDAVDVEQILAHERRDCFHLVTWCGGVRLAARLVEVFGARVLSLSLFAPQLDGADATDGYHSLVRFFEQFTSDAADVDRIAAYARDTWRNSLRRAPAANLDQYSPRAALRKSPLQYHPTDFTSRFTEDLLGDPGRIVDLARTMTGHDDSRTVEERLMRYSGPVLVISGTADALIAHGALRDRCARTPRWTLATVLGGNHYALSEHAPEAARLLRQFVRGGEVTMSTPGTVGGSRVRIARAPTTAPRSDPAHPPRQQPAFAPRG